jgi:hypothetical protein
VFGQAEIPPVVGMTSVRGSDFGASWPGTGSLHAGRDDTRAVAVKRKRVDREAQENEILPSSE